MGLENKTGIVHMTYISWAAFEHTVFEHRDGRVMDTFSRITVEAARRLFEKAEGSAADGERTGVVLATETGPHEAIKEFHGLLAQKGPAGINPSKFPNVMLSTPLARVTIELQAKGPAVPLYTRGGTRQAICYGVTQITQGRCDRVLVFYTNEDKGCFGLFIEKESSARDRGLTIRFYLD